MPKINLLLLNFTANCLRLLLNQESFVRYAELYDKLDSNLTPA